MNDQGARSRRAGWLLTGTILTVAALLAGIAIVATAIWPMAAPRSASAIVETDKHSYPRAASRLELDISTGDLSIVAGPPGRVDIERTRRWTGREPTIEESWLGDTLRIVTRCPGSGSQVCQVDQVLTVPAEAAAEIRVAAGDIEVRDIEGEVSLSTSAGGISLSGLAGPLSVRSSAGDIIGAGLRSPTAEVRLDAGTVQLGFDAAPERVTVQASAGSVTIEVPPGDAYQVRVDTTVGSRQIEVAQDPNADRAIEIDNAVGAVRVRYGA